MKILKFLLVYIFFKENKRMHTKTIPSSPMEVNNNYDRDDEQNYMEMSPGIEYMKMSPPGNQNNGNWLKAFSVPIRDLFWWYCV